MNERQLLDILVRFATTLTADFSIQDVLDQLVSQVADLLPVSGAGVLLMDDGPDHHFISTTDEQIKRIEGLQVELGEGPCLTAYETGRHVAVPDLAADTTLPRFSAAAHSAGLGAVFSFPLRHGDKRLGALELYSTDAVVLDQTELAGGQTLADVVASYLLIARRREVALRAAERLSVEALHDPLTGLPNRRLLDDRLRHAVERSHRSGLEFGVLFCDVDGFKEVNDRFGHQSGDVLLIDLSKRLASTLRPQDTLARVSGDEFVIVCEDLPDAASAEEVAGRTLAILDEPFGLGEDGQTIDLSMSVGVAMAGVEHDDFREALFRADSAMYEAKRLGGRRLALAAATPRTAPGFETTGV